MKKIRLISNVSVFFLLVFIFAIWFALSPDKDISTAERRPLKQFEDVLHGEKHPFDEIEGYFLDQFPLRDNLRTLKAFLYMDVFRKNDNNDIYKQGGTVVKIEDKTNEDSIQHAINVSNKVIDKYFKDNNVYYSVIPDKHYYASKENGYPAMDYEKSVSMLKESFNGKYVDIFDNLDLSDYYTTDSHWSQDKIADVAEKILSAMKNEEYTFGKDFFDIQTKFPFYGVYYGQSALSLPPDEIKYLTNEITDGMIMTYYDNLGKPVQEKVYVEAMFENKDPYDLFLAGAQSIVKIENPNSKTDKELVLFRDSFGSSIAPLLATEYKTVYVLDLRYVVPDMLPNFCQFDETQDVLFMYSTGLINSAKGIMNDFMMKQ